MFYGDVKESIPDNATEPRGKPIILRAFVTMQMTKSDIDPTWDSVSSSVWLALFGIQRDRKLWKVQFLAQNLLQ